MTTTRGRARLAALLLAGALSSCSGEETDAAEQIVGVASIELDGGVEFGESIEVELEPDVSGAALARVRAELSAVLDLEGSSRWAATELTLVRPGSDGARDVYRGAGDDLVAEDPSRLGSPFDDWLGVADLVGSAVEIDERAEESVVLLGDPATVAGDLATLAAAPAAATAYRFVDLRHDGLQLRVPVGEDPDGAGRALTAAGRLWDPAAVAWQDHDTAYRWYLEDLAYGGIDSAVVLRVDDPIGTDWTPQGEGDLVGAALDPLIAAIPEPDRADWTVELGDGSERGPTTLARVDATLPGEATAPWDAWLRDRLG